MTLGELETEIEYYNEDLKVVVEGEKYGLDGTFGSDRGDYYDLYFGLTTIKDDYNFTVKDFKKIIEKAYKQGIMRGYKGGGFNIEPDTLTRVGYYGYSGRFITRVVQKKDLVIIEIE